MKKPLPQIIIIQPLSPKWLSVPMAAQYTGLSNFAVEELLRSGEIPFILVHRRLVHRDDLDRWMDSRPRLNGKLKFRGRFRFTD
jgi:excisionase family DNA binding protein